ncbi:MAG: tetratricopeptide repeat protein [Candidatus Omnitrophica bacterium]|nr:tetratricopeptide repeat protein [Candidatus Omnitrophota bacterium]
MLFVIGVVIYGRTAAYDFVHDDYVFIHNNPAIQHLDFRSIFFTAAGGQKAGIKNVYFRPVLEFFYRLEYHWFRLNPAPWHIVNVLWHIGNSFLVFLLLRLIWPGRDAAAFLLAAGFLAHPVQTEAVACISGISNLVFAFFGLASFICYILAAKQTAGGKKTAWFAAGLGLFALAVFAKEQAIVLPAALFLYALSRQNPASSRERFWLGLYWLSAGFYLLWRRNFFGGSPLPFGTPEELRLRLLSLPHIILEQLRILVLPYDLHYYRNFDILSSWQGPGVIWVILIGLLIWRTRCLLAENRKRVWLGLGIFFIFLLPVLNIVPLVNEYSFVLNAEHFLYLPLLGALIVGDALLQPLVRKLSSSEKRLLAGGILAIWSLIAIVQLPAWAGEVSLFERVVRFEPRFGRGYLLLGKAYYFNGKWEKSLAAYDKALAIMEGYRGKARGKPAERFYLGFMKGIYFDMAHSYEALTRLDAAQRCYEEARRIDPKDAMLANSLGVACALKGQMAQAAAYFQEALRLDPHLEMARDNLRQCLTKGKK